MTNARYIYLIYLLIFFIALAYLNHLVPLMPGDDYIFSLKIPESGFVGYEKIDSLNALVESQINFYNNYHYRIIIHTILQSLLLLPASIFDILNTIIFFLIPLTFLKTNTSKSFEDKLLLYLLGLSVVWMFHFALGRSYFSTTGSLNYSWVLIPQLLFVKELYNKQNGRRNGLLVLLALLTASGNENVLLTLCICVFIILIYKFKIQKEKIDIALIISFFILAFGGIFMLVSPSLHWRIAEQDIQYTDVIYRFLEFLKRFVYYALRCLPLLLILLTAYKRRKLGSFQYYLLLIFCGSSLSMIMAPLYEPRTAVFGFMIILMLVFSLVDWSEGIKKPILYILLGINIFVTLYRICLFRDVYQYFSLNDKILEESRHLSTARLLPQCYNVTSGLVICEEISDDSDFVDNRTLAAYYDIDTVILDEKYSAYSKKMKFIDALRTNDFPFQKHTTYEVQNSEFDKIYSRNIAGNLELIIVKNEGFVVPIRSSIIVRGRKEKSISHKCLSILPLKLQISFLDYLEYTGDQDEEQGSIINFDGQNYYYSFILKPEKYDSYLIGLYDLDNHTELGTIYEFFPD